MTLRLPLVAASLSIVFVGALLDQPTAAQGSGPAGADQLRWENDRFRVSRIAIDAGSTAGDESGGDRVLVYLTADPGGRMPAAEAVWNPAGSPALTNRGRARVEAIAIELKDAAAAVSGGTPPEALQASDRVDVWRLIDNPRILVTKHRYAPATYTGPLHFHSEDVLVVYLRGGYTWPATAEWGMYPVRRGDLDVVPANTFHTVGNAGGDPLEFLMIVPR